MLVKINFILLITKIKQRKKSLVNLGEQLYLQVWSQTYPGHRQLPGCQANWPGEVWASVSRAELNISYGNIKAVNFIFAPTKFMSSKSQSQSQGHLW